MKTKDLFGILRYAIYGLFVYVVLVLVVALLFNVFPIQAQDFGLCQPGYQNVVIGDTVLENVPKSCVDPKTDYQGNGIYNPGTEVEWFETGLHALGVENVQLSGVVFVYMHIWQPDNTIETRYWVEIDQKQGLNVDQTALRNGEFEVVSYGVVVND